MLNFGFENSNIYIDFYCLLFYSENKFNIT